MGTNYLKTELKRYRSTIIYTKFSAIYELSNVVGFSFINHRSLNYYPENNLR